MKIKTLTAVTESDEIQVYKNCRVLLIESTTALNAETITLQIVGKSGSNINICTRERLIHLAEIQQWNEGAYIIATAAYNKYLYGINLSDNAAIMLENGEYLSINMFNLTSGTTYVLYGLEDARAANICLKYNKTNLNTPIKTITVSDLAKLFVIEATTDIDKIKLIYTNGTEEFTYTEMVFNMFNTNDNVAAGLGIIPETSGAITQSPLFGFKNLFILPIHNVQSIEISKTGSTEYVCFIIEEQVIM